MNRGRCTRKRRTCDCCGRPICRRCSRCCFRFPSTAPGEFTHRCPSVLCFLLKRLRLRPLRRGDTPRTGTCTGGEE